MCPRLNANHGAATTAMRSVTGHGSRHRGRPRALARLHGPRRGRKKTGLDARVIGVP